MSMTCNIQMQFYQLKHVLFGLNLAPPEERFGVGIRGDGHGSPEARLHAQAVGRLRLGEGMVAGGSRDRLYSVFRNVTNPMQYITNTL